MKKFFQGKIKFLIMIAFLFLFFFNTVAYSGLASKLAITSEAMFRASADIRVTGIKLESASNGAVENYSPKYNVDNTTTGFTLPNANSSITYRVTVTNYGDRNQTIYSFIKQSINKDGINVTVTGYKEKDIIKFNTSVEFLITITATTPDTNPINLIEQYEFRKVYTVEYQNTDGTQVLEPQYKYEKESLKLREDVLTKTDYDFKGWTCSLGDYAAGSEYTLDQDIILYPKFEKKKGKLDLNYNIDGTWYYSGYNNKIQTGIKVAGVDKGYLNDFGGTYDYGTSYEIYGFKIDGVTIPYSKKYTVDGNNYLNISFNTINFTVNNANLGSITPTQLIVIPGTTFTVSSNVITLSDGRIATASTKDVTGYKTKFSSYTITPNSTTINAKTTAQANFTKEAEKYTITLDNKSATTAGTTAIYEKYNTGIYLDSDLKTAMTTSTNAITKPSKTGYTFKGYYTKENGQGDQIINENGYITENITNTTYTANATVYAYYTINTYTITYNLNGGTVSTANPTSYNIMSSFTLNNPSRVGYTFNGWTGSNDASSGLNYTSSSPYTAKQRDHILGNDFSLAEGSTYRVFVTGKRVSGTLNLQGGIWYTEHSTGNGFDGYSGAFKKSEDLENGYAKYYKDISISTGYTKGRFYIQLEQATSGGTTSWSLYDMHVIKVSNSVSIPTGSTGNKAYAANWAPNTNTAYKVNHYVQDINTSTYTLNSTDSKTGTTGASLTLSDLKKEISGFTYSKGQVDGADALTTTILANGSRVINLYYTRNSYTVTYDATTNGGSTATQTSSVLYGGKADLTKKAEKSGYEFIGWNTNKDATSALTSYEPVTGNVTLYAIYSKTLTATFNYYNSKSETKSVTIYNNATSGSITSPSALGTPSGYTFRHYSTSNAANASKTIDANSAVVLTSNQTYYASYQKTVTLNFYYHSGTDTYANTQTSTTATGVQYLGYNNAIVNSTVSIPSAVTGSTGYYGTSYKGVTAANSTTPISVNTGTTNYYAYYQVGITYYYYNGSTHTSMPSESDKTQPIRTAYSNGTNYVTSVNITPTPSAYDEASFKGWSYTNDSVNDRNPAYTAMTSLYAYYQKTVTATFNYYDGSKAASATAGNTRTYISKSGGVNTINTNITIPDAAKANRGSYTYRGVSTGNTANASVVTPTTANTTYYSSYTYAITATFKANGGTGTAPSAVVGTGYMNYSGTKIGISVTMPSNTFARNGYTFGGWNDTVANKTYAAGTSTTIDSSRDFNATWNVVTYTIKYNLNGGTVSTANPTSYKITDADITLNNPTKPGYTFTGWTGTGLSEASTTVTIKSGSYGNREYTANYSINQYYYDVNPDSGIKSFDITIDGKTSKELKDYNQKHNYGTEATITNVVAKTGYIYTGYKVTGSMTTLTGSTNSNIKTKLGAGNGAIGLTSTANALTFDAQTLASIKYSTTPQALVFKGADNGTGSYSYAITAGNTNSYFTINGTTITTSDTAVPPVGTYKLTIQATDNTSKVTATAEITIVIEEASSINPTLTAYSGTYDGQPHTIGVTGGSGGTIHYSTDNKTWSTTKPARTDVGTTTIYVKVVGDRNHTDTSPIPSTITIKPATITYTASSYEGFYDGNGHTISVSVTKPTSGATITYSTSANGTYSATKPSYTAAGTYTIYFKIEAANYTTKTDSRTVKINTTNLSGSVTITGTNTWGQTLTANVTNTNSATLSYQWYSTTSTTATGGTAIADATENTYKIDKSLVGKYIYVVVTASKTNYNKTTWSDITDTTNKTATVAKQALSVTANAATASYDGKEHNATVKVNSASWDGKTIVSGTSTSYGSTVTSAGVTGTTYNLLPSRTAKGTTSISYKITGGSYYNDFTGTSSVAINPAGLSGSVKITGTNTWGNTLTASVTNTNSATLSYQWYSTTSTTATGGTAISGATKNTYEIDKSLVGKYIYVVVTASKANYDNATWNDITDTATNSTGPVAKKSATISFASSSVTINYGESAKNTLTNTGDGTVSYTSSNTNVATINSTTGEVTIKQAGTTTIKAKVADVAYYTYSTKTISYTLTVKKITNPAKVSPVTGIVYGETKAMVSATGVQGTIYYSTETELTEANYLSKGSQDIPSSSGRDAGTYNIYYYVTGNSNYNAASNTSSTPVKTTIGKATNPIAITSPQSWTPTFSTSAQTKAITAATGGQGSVTYAIKSQKNSSGTAVTNFTLSGTTVTMAASTSVGTYTVVITATAAGNSNYNSGSKDITLNVTVGKATNPISITSPQSWTPTFSTSAQTKAITAATGGQGSVTYAIKSQKNSSGTAVTNFTLSGTTVTMAASTSVGTYTVVITATAAGNGNYNSGSKDITLNVTVNPATLPAPTNIKITTAGIVTWDSVSNASSYQISIDGTNWTTATSGVDYLSKIIASTGARTVYVKAIGTGNYSNSNPGSTSVNVYKITINSNSTTMGTVDTSSYNAISGSVYSGSINGKLTILEFEKGSPGKVLKTVTATPEKNYVFKKWSSASGTISSNITVTANFAGAEYTISLDDRGATAVGTIEIYERYNTGIYLDKETNSKQMTTSSNPITIPTIDPYTLRFISNSVVDSTVYFSPTFMGYYTIPVGGGQMVNKDGYITNNLTNTTYTSNVTLYAHWFSYYTLPTTDNPGYSCKWEKDNVKYNQGAQVSIDGDSIFYDICDANKYTVTFDGNGGTVSSESKTVTYDESYGELPTATRTLDENTNISYVFEGWYTSANGGEKVESTTKYKVAGNQTLYAHWLSSPIIKGGSSEWYNKAATISLATPSVSNSGSVKYQYYLSETNELPSGSISWTDITSTDGSVSISTNGEFYIFYKAISTSGASITSNYNRLRIDTKVPSTTISAYKTGTTTTVTSNTWSNKGLEFKMGSLSAGPSGGSIYYCIGDSCTPGTLISPNTAIPASSTNTKTGTYHVRYKVVSGSGLSSSIADYTAKVDTTAPTMKGVITSLKDSSTLATLTNSSTSYVDSTWRNYGYTINLSGTTDGESGIAKIEKYTNANNLSRSDTDYKSNLVSGDITSTKTYTEKANGAKYAKYVATDNAGNKATFIVEVLIDTEGPTLKISVYKADDDGNKTGNALLSNQTSNYTFKDEKTGENLWVNYHYYFDLSASSDSLSGIDHYRFQYSPGGKSAIDTSKYDERNIAAGSPHDTVKTNGARRLIFTAYDKAGNTKSFWIDVFVDTNDPAVTLKLYKADSDGKKTGSALRTITAANTPVNSWANYRQYFDLTGTKDGLSGIASITMQANKVGIVDTGSSVTGASDLTASYNITSAKGKAIMSSGNRYVRITVKDKAGNSVVHNVRIYIDLGAPTLASSSLSPRFESSTTITYKCTDTMSGFAAFGTKTLSKTYTKNVTSSNSPVTVQCKDTAGNTSSDKKTYTWSSNSACGTEEYTYTGTCTKIEKGITPSVCTSKGGKIVSTTGNSGLVNCSISYSCDKTGTRNKTCWHQ